MGLAVPPPAPQPDPGPAGPGARAAAGSQTARGRRVEGGCAVGVGEGWGWGQGTLLGALHLDGILGCRDRRAEHPKAGRCIPQCALTNTKHIGTFNEQ